jgi:hypothetical protein
MHLVVPFASAWANTHAPDTPHIHRLLQQGQETSRDEADELQPLLPHERLLARAWGWHGGAPFAARQAQHDGIAVGNAAWGLLTPVHWQVGAEAIHLADPAELHLSEADSRTLLELLRPWFEGEGFTVAWGAPLRWYVAHPSLATLSAASLDRVLGRNVDRWLPGEPEARLIRRLQNEAQMLLHTHPINQAREARGVSTVNSFWLSGCGVAQAEAAHDVQVDHRLRAPSLAQDADALAQAWAALDARVGQGGLRQLSLCGERSAITWTPARRSATQQLWRRLTQPAPSLKDLLACI